MRQMTEVQENSKYSTEEWRDNIAKLNAIGTQMLFFEQANENGAFNEKLIELSHEWENFFAFSQSTEFPYRDHLLRRNSFSYAMMNMIGTQKVPQEVFVGCRDSDLFIVEQRLLDEQYKEEGASNEDEIAVIDEPDIQQFMQLTAFYYCNPVLNICDGENRDTAQPDSEHGKALKALTGKLEKEKRFDEMYVIRNSIMLTWVTRNILITNNPNPLTWIEKAEDTMTEFYSDILLPSQETESSDEETAEGHGLTSADIPEEPPKGRILTSADIPKLPLLGGPLLEKIKELQDKKVSLNELTKGCGYKEDSKTFYEAFQEAKIIHTAIIKLNGDVDAVHKEIQQSCLDNFEEDLVHFCLSSHRIIWKKYLESFGNHLRWDEDLKKAADDDVKAYFYYRKMVRTTNGIQIIYIAKCIVTNWYAEWGNPNFADIAVRRRMLKDLWDEWEVKAGGIGKKRTTSTQEVDSDKQGWAEYFDAKYSTLTKLLKTDSFYEAFKDDAKRLEGYPVVKEAYDKDLTAAIAFLQKTTENNPWRIGGIKGAMMPMIGNCMKLPGLENNWVLGRIDELIDTKLPTEGWTKQHVDKSDLKSLQVGGYSEQPLTDLEVSFTVAVNDCDFDSIFKQAETYKELILVNIGEIASNFTEENAYEPSGEEPDWLIDALLKNGAQLEGKADDTQSGAFNLGANIGKFLS